MKKIGMSKEQEEKTYQPLKEYIEDMVDCSALKVSEDEFLIREIDYGEDDADFWLLKVDKARKIEPSGFPPQALQALTTQQAAEKISDAVRNKIIPHDGKFNLPADLSYKLRMGICTKCGNFYLTPIYLQEHGCSK